MRTLIVFVLFCTIGVSDDGSPTDRALALNKSGLAYYHQHDYARAEQACKEALALFEKAYGPEHPDVAAVQNNLASIYTAEKRYAEAEPLYLSSLAYRQRVFGAGRPEVATILNNLAELYRKTGDFARAETGYQRAIDIWGKSGDSYSQDLATALTNLSLLYAGHADWSKAEPLYERALKIRKESGNRTLLAETLVGLATVRLNLGKFGEAAQLDEQAIETLAQPQTDWEQKLLAKATTDLGQIYTSQGRLDEAESLLTQALALENGIYGADSANQPEVGITLKNTATLLRAQQRYADAKPLYRRAIAILRRAMGAQNTAVAVALNGLGLAYSAQKEYDEAALQFRQAIDIFEKNSDPADLAHAAALSNLAWVYFVQHHYDKALPLMEQSMRIWETAAPGNAEATAARKTYAAMLRKTKHNAEADRVELHANSFR